MSIFSTTTSALETVGMPRPLFHHWRAAESAHAREPRGGEKTCGMPSRSPAVRVVDEACRTRCFVGCAGLQSRSRRKVTHPARRSHQPYNRFIADVRRFKRVLVAPLNWKKVVMAVDGRKYPVFFRDAFEAV